jgi:hypothetical protein
MGGAVLERGAGRGATVQAIQLSNDGFGQVGVFFGDGES